MHADDIQILPGVGWSNVQLGGTFDEVREALATNGHAYDVADDECMIDLHAPEITFYFDDSAPRRLVQMVFYDMDHRVHEQMVIGQSLSDALRPFRLTSFEESLWSLVSIEEEYQHGAPLSDARRIRRSTPDECLECGTLWLKSQGVGLVMLFGVVHAIALRHRGDCPNVGCGQLDSDTLRMSLRRPSNQTSTNSATPIREYGPTIAEEYGSPGDKSKRNATKGQEKARDASPSRYLLSTVWTLLSIGFFCLPAAIVYRDLTAWKESRSVVGQVVATKPEGPFPDEIVVEYTVPDSGTHQVTISSTYTTARDITQEVELQYLPDQPDRAMTRIQIRDEGWSISPYLLFGSIALATFLLHLAFPNHIGFQRRRS